MKLVPCRVTVEVTYRYEVEVGIPSCTTMGDLYDVAMEVVNDNIEDLNKSIYGEEEKVVNVTLVR